jgi:tetratricopeptide (TPR) repeat protein
VTRAWHAAAVLAAACSLLAGCATRGPLLDPTTRSVELVDTPFFPQSDYQCGPAALATVLVAAGVAVTPEELVPQVYVPARRGSLTPEMQAAPRRYGRIAYPVAPELQAIVAELAAGRQVLVLHNYGLPIWPRWHYAVVIGYDAARQQLLLRSGTKQRQQMGATSFMRAWDNADRWALVMLKPGELPAAAERAPYLEAVTAFERLATPTDSRLAFDAAIARWPEEPVVWVGRGTAHYRAGDLRAAAGDYGRAVTLDPALVGARNNLAMALLELGCPASAQRELDRIDRDPLQGALRDAVADTARQITARLPAADGATCSGLY